MNNKKPLLITLAAFFAILLLIIMTALLLRGRGGQRVDDAPYPYQWTERSDGSVRLTLDGGAVKEGVWIANDPGDDVVNAKLGETKRGKATVTLTPAAEGRTERSFALINGEERLAEVRLAVETLQKDNRLAVTVIDHSEQARQSRVSGGDAAHPYTACADDTGDLVLHIADAGAAAAEESDQPERWTAASSDELIASILELRTVEDGVEVRVATHVSGDAEVTVSGEEAGVTYMFAVTSDSGALRLRDCIWSAYEPQTPITEEEMNEILSGIADSLAGLEAAAEP